MEHIALSKLVASERARRGVIIANLYIWGSMASMAHDRTWTEQNTVDSPNWCIQSQHFIGTKVCLSMSTTSMPISTSFYSLRTAFNFNTPSPSPSPVTEPNANIIETRGDSRYAFTTMPRRTDPANGLQKTKAGYTFSIAIRWPPSTKK